VHYNLGNALYILNNVAEAIQHYKIAIDINPNKSETFYNLANAYSVK
jgi:tetratricopeptide (TPR) repeat protein